MRPRVFTRDPSVEEGISRWLLFPPFAVFASDFMSCIRDLCLSPYSVSSPLHLPPVIFRLFLSRFDDTDDFLLFIYSFPSFDFRWRAYLIRTYFPCKPRCSLALPPLGIFFALSPGHLPPSVTSFFGYLMTSPSPPPLQLHISRPPLGRARPEPRLGRYLCWTCCWSIRRFNTR